MSIKIGFGFFLLSAIAYSKDNHLTSCAWSWHVTKNKKKETTIFFMILGPNDAVNLHKKRKHQ